MLRLLGRLILIPLGLLLGCATSLLILVTIGLERITQELAAAGKETDALSILFDFVRGGLRLGNAATILPALLVVIVGEVGRIRYWLYYMVGGGAALAAVPLLSRIWDQQAIVLPSALVWQLFATAGFAGGLVYWLIAGRNA